jgi:hypothetical protein
MAITFFGPWSLRVLSKDAAFEERVTIRGSQNSDGSFPGIPGTTIAAIQGAEWTVEMEWSSDGGVTWNPSAIRRTDEVTQADGLVVTLGADDNVPERRDSDFNDLVVFLKCLDPKVNPPPNPDWYDFTLPVDAVRPASGGGIVPRLPPRNRPGGTG